MVHSRRWLAYWHDRAAQRRVWAIALPLILSNISVPLVGLVDTAVIGHLDAAYHLGAVAVGSSCRKRLGRS